MDVVVASRAEVPMAIERLSRLGYLHQGDMGVAGREAFRPWDAVRHHLYLCAEDNLQLQLHLQLRDYLRTHPAAAQEYAALNGPWPSATSTTVKPILKPKLRWWKSCWAAPGREYTPHTEF
jgi:GrpB-like predicted nucleotidyltransferase (UPF0157 family)